MKHRRLSLKLLRSRASRSIFIAGAALLFIVFLILILRPEPQLRNSAEVAIIKENGVLRVGVHQNMPGFCSDGVGLEAELAQRFATDLLGSGETLLLVPLDGRTAGPHLDNGDVDVVLSLQVRGELSQYEYSRAYYVDKACFAVQPGSENTPLSQLIVGTIQTSVLTSRLDARLEEEPGYVAQQKLYASYPDLFAALEKGQVNAALIPHAYALRYQEEAGFSLHAEVFGELEYALMCSTDAPALAELFNMLLNQLEQDGTLLELCHQNNLE